MPTQCPTHTRTITHPSHFHYLSPPTQEQMSTEGSDFVRATAAATFGHGSSSSNQSDLSTPTTAKHVRMGRGLVKVTRYENEVHRGKRSPVSPVSLAASSPLGDDASPGQSPRRKWFNTPILRRRNVSLGGGLPITKDLSMSARRGDIKSWVDTQVQEGWNLASQVGAYVLRPKTLFDAHMHRAG
jgi:hypothetical protein